MLDWLCLHFFQTLSDRSPLKASGCMIPTMHRASLFLSLIMTVDSKYWYIVPCRADPNGIFAFLIQQLQEAEDAGQRAWVIGHMPPGGPDTLHDQVS